MSLLLQDKLVLSPETAEHLQEEIDTLEAATDVADVVATKSDLDSYDTSKLTDNSIVKVLQDSTHNDAQAYYRYSKSTDSFTYIGSIGPYVELTTNTSRVYGTDAQGNQTTYDKNDFGKVDDVKVDNVSIVTNKIANIDLTGKVDKVNSASKIYGTDSSSNQTTYDISTNATASTIAYRAGSGTLTVGTPSSNYHATTKKYVDDADALKQNKPTITTSSASTYSVTPADNTVYNCTASALTSLSITVPSSLAVDYTSELNFTSGSTATTVTSTGVKWIGDNVNENTGFAPRVNCRYTIVFTYDGTNFRGLVQGISL
jgi:hypothetical protein